jgi:hypothetical protein
MNDAASSTAESSWLLWSLGACVAWLAAHVALGWSLQAQRQADWPRRLRASAIGSAALGTGLCTAAVLSLSAEALVFPIGYRGWMTPALWVAAMLCSVPVLLWPAVQRRGWSLVGSGALLASLACAVQAGWIEAAGFRPGVVWDQNFVAAAWVFMTLGCGSAQWVTFLGPGRDGRYSRLWRVGAAALLGLSFMFGQELLMTAAGVLGQAGSVYRYEVSGTALSLIGGVLVPVLLSTMAIDLALRRRTHRRSESATTLTRRRRRRHRVRSL